MGYDYSIIISVIYPSFFLTCSFVIFTYLFITFMEALYVLIVIKKKCIFFKVIDEIFYSQFIVYKFKEFY